jgi:hypothetical protein
MSQLNVERIIGLLATDEAMRRSFSENPRATLHTLVQRGLELTAWELTALASLDPRRLARFVQGLDLSLQRADLRPREP